MCTYKIPRVSRQGSRESSKTQRGHGRLLLMLRQVYKISPLLRGIPNHQTCPDRDIGGREMRETESGCKTEALYKHLKKGTKW